MTEEFQRVFTPKPVADHKATVTGEKYRFTVLFDEMLRMEYCPDGIFEDRPTRKIFNRKFDVPEFTVKDDAGVLKIRTKKLCLFYNKQSFEKFGLSITVYKENHICSNWQFGDSVEYFDGTAKTLDNADGPVALEKGIISKSGISIIDDSKTIAIDKYGWAVPSVKEHYDIYFMYEPNPEKALQMFYSVSGNVPMLPRYVLGNWWSRWHKYTDIEYEQLIEKFRENKIPLSVAVLDIDWHHTDDLPSEYGSSWTGYSWNKNLIPNPTAFIEKLHKKGLHVSLNEHPKEGIRSFEDCYKAAAEYMGLNPEENKPITFDVANKRFMECYFKCVLNPIEDENGVDFWWTDWQQQGGYSVAGYDTLWMLNHYHYVDNARNGKRPLAFSRYSGLGSHRYPIGFSGDTKITWSNLDFQPYFTASAANVGYSWWSHDIGGFGAGSRDDELQTRWVQLGVFSPVFRLHSMNNVSKEPWLWGKEYFDVISSFMRFRHILIPYLYTMNYRNSNEGIPLVRPLHHAYSDYKNTNSFKNEYLFGSELIVCPITQKCDSVTRTGSVRAYIPKGLWTDIFTGMLYEGDREISLHRDISSIPALARPGAIIPMSGEKEQIFGTENPQKMEIWIFPGADNKFELYEDNDAPVEYLKSVKTRYVWKFGENCQFNVEAAQGDSSVIPGKRDYTFKFFGLADTDKIMVKLSGKETELLKKYDAEKNIIIVSVRRMDVNENVEISISDAKIAVNNEKIMAERILDYSYIQYDFKSEVKQILDSAANKVSLLSSLNFKIKDDALRDALFEVFTAQG